MMRRTIDRGARLVLVGVATTIVATVGWSQSLTWLGTLGGGSSRASGVSADGSVVVGTAYDSAGRYRAFRWQRGVMQDLGTLGGANSQAFGVSADGSVVVGTAYDSAGRYRAFRWQNNAMQDLGTLGGSYSGASDVSADGSVVVGSAHNAAGHWRAFRWQNNAMQDLGTLGGVLSEARGVSPDGTVVVGRALNSAGRYRAFRWMNGVMQDLGTPRQDLGSCGVAVSADGLIVVGWAADNDDEFAVRWTQQSIATTLPAAYFSDITHNGSVVVGGGFRGAFRWTLTRGVEYLNETYASLRGSSDLQEVSAISPDGRYIVGTGYNATTGRSEAFLLDTWRTGDTNGNGCIDDSDLLAVLFAFGSAGTGYTRHEDVNKDGIVDDADLLVVLFNFGSGC